MPGRTWYQAKTRHPRRTTVVYKLELILTVTDVVSASGSPYKYINIIHKRHSFAILANELARTSLHSNVYVMVMVTWFGGFLF